MLTFALLLAPIYFTVIPALARTWSQLLGIVVVCGGFLAFVWLDHGIAATGPDYDLKLSGAFGLTLVTLATIGFVAMSTARAIGLVLQSRGFSRRGLWWLDFAGVLAVVAVIVVPYQYGKRIARRPPPQACLARPIPVTVAGRQFLVPHGEVISIYLADAETTPRYLFSPEHHRDLCRQALDGTRPLPVSAVAFRFRNIYRHGTCNDSGTEWGRELCAEKVGARGYPDELLIYQEGSISKGGFGTGAPSYAAYRNLRAREPWREGGVVLEAGGRVARYADGFLVARGIIPEDGDPLTAACRGYSDHLGCTVDELRAGGLGVNWSFDGPPELAASRFLTLSAWIDDVLASLE